VSAHPEGSVVRAPLVLAALLAVFAVNYMDRQILAILIEPVKHDLQLSDTQAGLLYGFAFAVFYSLLGIPIARLADRSSRMRIITGSLVLFSAMTMVCGLAVSYWQLLLARIGVAVGEAGTNPASHSIIADLYPVKHRSTAMAIFALGPHLGIVLSFVVGGLAAEWLGWRQTFLITGALGLIVAPLAARALRHLPQAAASSDAQSESLSVVVRGLLRHRSIRHIFAGATIVSLNVSILMGWLPSLLIRSHHFSVASVGLLLAVVLGLAGGVGTLLGGVIADQLGKRNPGARLLSVAGAFLIAIPAWAVALGEQTTFMTFAGLTLGGMLVAVHLGPSFAMVQSLARPGSRALAAALLLFAANLVGAGLGPLAVGMISDALAADQGADSLRLALWIVLPVYLWAAFHYWMAARSIARDLHDAADAVDAIAT